MYHIKKDNATNLFYKKLKIFVEIKNIYAILITMRQGKKERLKQNAKKAKKALINEYAIYATSSIYTSNILGVSLLGGNDSKYHYIKEFSNDRVISLIDKKNKYKLDRLKNSC
ncbi:hypothetical protein HTVC115P_gp02 [Pelagibacter phage HTVC115P]|nr:hypothetical protein HTVC115P_gp02 [Pelagibacter phage HTVC115P]